MEHNYLHETYNCVTGETTIVPLTEEELAQLQAAQVEITAEREAQAARLSAKLAIYAKLGLTEEEINTLLS
jgi:hypothetical protein